MTDRERIRNLEIAVLHLTRAANCLVAAIQEINHTLESPPDPTRGTRVPDGRVQEAFGHLKKALNTVAEDA